MDFELNKLLSFVVFMFGLKGFLEVKGVTHTKDQQNTGRKNDARLLEINYEKYQKDRVHCSYLLLFVLQKGQPTKILPILFPHGTIARSSNH